MTTTTGLLDLRAAPGGEWSWIETQPLQVDQHRLRGRLTTFEPITLAEMDGAALLDRSELKYVLPQHLLLPLLSELRDAFQVLVVAGQPFSHYRTLYFDTADLAMYRRHHAGAPDRYKVRAREYVDSHVAFLEVKHKTGLRHTVKNRIPTELPVTALPRHAAGFLAQACPYPVDVLTACLWNDYTRITLVSKQRTGRVTLDLDLAFAWGEQRVALPGIVVVEAKYEGLRHAAEFTRLMRAHHMRDTSFSKYCMGVSLLYPQVKHNRFKAKQRLVTRLTQGVSHELC